MASFKALWGIALVSLVCLGPAQGESVKLICDWMGQPTQIFDVDYSSRTVAYISGYFTYYPHDPFPAQIDDAVISWSFAATGGNGTDRVEFRINRLTGDFSQTIHDPAGPDYDTYNHGTCKRFTGSAF